VPAYRFTKAFQLADRNDPKSLRIAVALQPIVMLSRLPGGHSGAARMFDRIPRRGFTENSLDPAAQTPREFTYRRRLIKKAPYTFGDLAGI
jgi:hypothetical protein